MLLVQSSPSTSTSLGATTALVPTGKVILELHRSADEDAVLHGLDWLNATVDQIDEDYQSYHSAVEAVRVATDRWFRDHVV